MRCDRIERLVKTQGEWMRMPIYAWLMPLIGVAALISFVFSGRPAELAVGIIALGWGILIYRRRLR